MKNHEINTEKNHESFVAKIYNPDEALVAIGNPFLLNYINPEISKATGYECKYRLVKSPVPQEDQGDPLPDNLATSKGVFGWELLNQQNFIDTWKGHAFAKEKTNNLAFKLKLRLIAMSDASLARADRILSTYPIPEELKIAIESTGEESTTKALSRLDDETFLKFLKWNQDHINDFANKHSEDLYAYANDFKVAIGKAIELGLPLSRQYIDEMLGRLKLAWTDPLSGEIERMGGAYNEKNETASIVVKEPSELARKVVFHEILHHLSGKTQMIEVSDDPDYGVTDLEIATLRVGLGQKGVGPHRSEPEEIFSWKLNEAVTEIFTQMLLRIADGEEIKVDDFNPIYDDDRSKGAYRKERKILDYLLRNSNLEWKNLTDAYFENFNPDLPQDERSIAQKYLYDELHKLDFRKTPYYEMVPKLQALQG